MTSEVLNNAFENQVNDLIKTFREFNVEEPEYLLMSAELITALTKAVLDKTNSTFDESNAFVSSYAGLKIIRLKGWGRLEIA